MKCPVVSFEVSIGLVGIYCVPLPAEYFSAFLFCLDCCVLGALSVSWKFVAPL